VVVDVDDRVQQFGVMVFFHSEGFRHEFRADSVLFGEIFEFLACLFVDGFVLYLFEVAQYTRGVLFAVALVFDLVDGEDIWELDLFLVSGVLFHQFLPADAFHFLLFELLPSLALLLLLFFPLALFALVLALILLVLEEEVVVDDDDFVVVGVQLRVVLQVDW
jgi:hypothetical protein